MQKRIGKISVSVALFALVAALAAPAALADGKPGLAVQNYQAAGNQVNVVVANSDSVDRTGVVVVDAVVAGERVISVQTVKVSGGSMASVTVGMPGAVAGVVGIILDDAAPS